MRKYSFSEYPYVVRRLFNYLEIDYGFSLTEERCIFSYIFMYEKNDIRIDLNYDIHDNFFYFKIIRGKYTKYPNDNDRENIKAFYHLFQKYEPDLDLKKLQPDDNQYVDALKLNADLLRKYGGKVLRGEEWI